MCVSKFVCECDLQSIVDNNVVNLVEPHSSELFILPFAHTVAVVIMNCHIL